MSNEVDAFLEHHGVKGQKWGYRNKRDKQAKRKNASAQRAIDLVRKIASGTATPQETHVAIKVGLLSEDHVFNKHNGNASAAAREVLDRQLKYQDKVKNGKGKAFRILSAAKGLNVKKLDYSYTNPNK